MKLPLSLFILFCELTSIWSLRPLLNLYKLSSRGLDVKCLTSQQEFESSEVSVESINLRKRTPIGSTPIFSIPGDSVVETSFQKGFEYLYS
jgi:hypothetical protein